MCAKTQVTETLTSYVVAMYVPATNMPLKCHIYVTYVNDDDTTWLYKLSWPRIKIVKKQFFQDHHTSQSELSKLSAFKTNTYS